MKFFLALLLAAVAISTDAISCPENYCASVTCAAVSQSNCEQCQNGVYAPHGTFCGCCAACLTKIPVGGNCQRLLIRGVPPTAACDPPSTCQTGADGVAVCTL